MAYSSITKPTDYFNTLLYTGNGSSGRSVTGVGFQPDWIWIKDRTDSNPHKLFDAPRGVSKSIKSNSSDSEATTEENGYVSAFNSDGFTLTQGSSSQNDVNKNSNTYVSWNWEGGTTSGLSGGNITPSAYSYNATSGFGVYKYTGNGSADQTIPHGLGAVPQLIFYKRLDSGTNWVVQSNLLGNKVQLVLNGTDAENTDSRLGSSDNWTSTFFNVGTYGDMNSNGDPHVAYVFCNVKGYSKIGTYKGGNDTGTAGSINDTFIFTGFKPAFLLVKKFNSSGTGWFIFDNKRDDDNPISKFLMPQAANNEDDNLIRSFDLLSNGFKSRGNSDDTSGAGSSYIYMAFAENPFVGNVSGTAVPVTAR